MRCSFCARDEAEVKQLFAPNEAAMKAGETARICDVCVRLSAEALDPLQPDDDFIGDDRVDGHCKVKILRLRDRDCPLLPVNNPGWLLG